MLVVNDDLSIYVTRGDAVAFSVTSEENGVLHVFQPGDVVRIKVYGKKDAESVVLQRDFPVFEASESVEIMLSEQDTKFGGVISKPTDYWYEIELNPFTNPQTIIGYDEDGPKIFKVYPEGADVPEIPVDPEVVKLMDDELDMTSTRPVENQAIARAITQLRAAVADTNATMTARTSAMSGNIATLDNEIGVERARVDNLVASAVAPVDADANYLEVADIRVGADGKTYGSAGAAVREQLAHVSAELNSVTPQMTVFCDPSTNVFDKNAVHLGGYWEDGVYKENSAFQWTELYVKPNTLYSDNICLPVYVSFYDASMQFIGKAYHNTDFAYFAKAGEWATPSNARFVRISLRINEVTHDLSKLMVVEGANIPDEYVEHSKFGGIMNSAEMGKRLAEFFDSDEVQNGINKSGYAGKKVCFIGDSMIDVPNTLTPWWQMVADHYAFGEVYNRGIGGTKVIADGVYSLVNKEGVVHTQHWEGEDSEIPDGCTKILRSLSKEDRCRMIPSDTDVVVVMAGVNDFNANGLEGSFNYPFEKIYIEYKSAYSQFIEYVIGRLPNATVFVCTLLNSANTKGAGLNKLTRLPVNGNGNTTKDFAKWTKEVAEQFGVYCIDTFGTSGINYLNRNLYCIDDVHPYTEEGQKKIARAVIKGMSDLYMMD